MTEIVTDKKDKVYVNKLDKMYWACYRGVRDFVSPIWYRFFGSKPHIVRTNLTPSGWYDFDARYLHATMELVKWFVEKDMRKISEKDYEDELKDIEEREEGEQKDFLLEEWKDLYDRQSQVIGIYDWWLDYPNREKEVEASLSAIFDYERSCAPDVDENRIFSFIEIRQSLNKEQYKESRRLSDIHNDLENKLAEEEKEMLHRVVDLKDGMWS